MSLLKVVLILPLVFGATTVNGQTIKKVDLSRIIEEGRQFEIIDSTFKLTRDLLLSKKEIWIREFVEDAEQRIKGASCSSRIVLEKLQNELTKEEKEISSFEKFITDTLPVLRKNTISLAETSIKSSIAKYGKSQEIDFIIDTAIIYYDDSSHTIDDVTDHFLKVSNTQEEIQYTLRNLESTFKEYDIDKKSLSKLKRKNNGRRNLRN